MYLRRVHISCWLVPENQDGLEEKHHTAKKHSTLRFIMFIVPGIQKYNYYRTTLRKFEGIHYMEF